MRLRNAYLLLIAAPAMAFAIGGSCIAQRSRAALEPELDRHAAARASELVRYERQRLRDRLHESRPQVADVARELAIERLTVYDSLGTVGTFPVDSAAVPFRIEPEQGEAMLAAARRGVAVVDLARFEGRSLWLAYVPLQNAIAAVLMTPDSLFADRFLNATGYDVARYYDYARIPPAEGDWPHELPVALLDSLAEFDRPLSTNLEGASIAAAPIKDFDDWDVVGAVTVRRTDQAPSIPAPPWLPIVAMFLAVLVPATILWDLGTSARHQPRRLRRAFTIALVPPALAATWLAISDARISARAADAKLRVSAGAIGSLPDITTLAVGELAGLSGTDAVVLQGDSIMASTLEIPTLSLEELEEGSGRLHQADRRLAYRTVALGDDASLILVTTPLEDSRKAVLFWLAGLYGLLAAGVLVFASLVLAAGSDTKLHEAKTAWAFISPSLILLLLFSAGPLLFALYLSFHGWNLLEPAKPFVGLRHYIELAGDGLFWNAAKNTALYSLYVPATMVCALGVAMLLNRSIKGIALLRAIFFLPYITSFVAISIVWQWMYDPDFGVFNWGLGLIGLGPFPWLNSPSTALLALILMAVWIHIGFQMIIFLAGLQAIPNEFYEAAMIDGASAWRRFWRITVPLLKPTTFFVLVTSIIGSFQVFTFVYVMTEGGPLHATDVIVYHIYQNAWQFLRMGYASAMSWVLFAVIFLITLLQFRLLGRKMAPS
jgi:ABC-type sugar transport system permease subunit